LPPQGVALCSEGESTHHGTIFVTARQPSSQQPLYLCRVPQSLVVRQAHTELVEVELNAERDHHQARPLLLIWR